MSKKIVVTGAMALVFGGGAVFLADVWLERNKETVVVEKEVKADIELTPVLVAASDIGYGTTVREEVVRIIEWPTDSLPAGTFESVEQLSEDGDRVVLETIRENEPILAAKMTGSGETARLSRKLEAGERAVTIRVDVSTGVAGFVAPGDRVDVVLVREFRPDNDRNEGEDVDPTQRAEGVKLTDQKVLTENENIATASIVLENAKVIAVDQTPDTQQDSAFLYTTVTLALDPKRAQKLSAALRAGELALHLRKAGEVAFEPAAGIDPAPTAAFEAETPVETTTQVRVRHAGELEVVTVPNEGVQ